MFSITLQNRDTKEEFEAIFCLKLDEGIWLDDGEGNRYEVVSSHKVDSIYIDHDEIEKTIKKSFGLFPIDLED